MVGWMDGTGLGFKWEWDGMGLSGVVEATLPYFENKTNHLHQITATFFSLLLSLLLW
jgi:hypothetical protein